MTALAQTLTNGVLAALGESSDDAIIVTDLEARVLSWNPGATRLYGYHADEMVGQSLAILWPESQAGAFPTHFRRLQEGQRVEQFETVRVAKDGRFVHVAVSLVPVRDDDGTVVAALSVARDIRLQKRREEALSGSQARWRALLDSAVDGIVLIDAHGRIEAFNPAAERLFGYDERELLGKNVSILMPSSYGEEHDGYLARYLREGGARIIGKGREVTGQRRDGSTFPVHLSVGETSLDGEQRFTGILHDLSARAALEYQLRSSEARWRAIIESAVDGIVVIDGRGCIESFNPAAERLFGYQEGEVIGKNVSMLMPSPYHEEHDGYLARYQRDGHPRIIGIGREVVGRRKDGSTVPVHLSVGEMALGGEPRFTGILHDLSSRTMLEEQLREQAALVRLGEMAAVIAHEVRNPLAGIRGAVQVIGNRLKSDSVEHGVVKEIVARIDSLSELMSDMLLFARPPQPRLAPVPVRALVSSTVELFAEDPTLKGMSIRVEGDAPLIEADAALLKIVIQNLLVNGAQAVQGKGTIVVSVTASDRACAITVVDDGPGIPSDVRDKIFLPFFTTKSRGTGLGLATCRRLVEAHHGNISVRCPPDGGTSVRVELPLQR